MKNQKKPGMLVIKKKTIFKLGAQQQSHVHGGGNTGGKTNTSHLSVYPTRSR